MAELADKKMVTVESGDSDEKASPEEELAEREGKLTAIFEFDGTPIGSAKMPMWTEAVFAQRSLILSRPRSSGQGHVVWMVDEQSLEIQRYCFEENGGLAIR